MATKVMTLGTTVVYENEWLRVRTDRILQNDKESIYGVIERSDSVVIIPLSQSNNTVLLKQYRHPTGLDSWELPMGGIDKHEFPEAAARRELLEETQIRASNIELLGVYFAVPALTPQRVHVFLTRVDEIDLVKAHAAEHVDDIQDSRIASIDEVYRMVSEGQITDGFTLVGLLYLKLHAIKNVVV